MIPGDESHPSTFWEKIEEYFLSVLLLIMMLLVCAQIILRSFFSGGLIWADAFIRYLVLWSGMLGAALATARGKHISIDFAAHFFPPAFQPWLQLLVQIFSCLASVGLCYASWLFINNEYSFGGQGPFGAASWLWNLVFPLTFFLIALRSVCKLVASLNQLCRLETENRTDS